MIVALLALLCALFGLGDAVRHNVWSCAIDFAAAYWLVTYEPPTRRWRRRVA